MNILELIKDCEVEWKSLGEVATLQRGRVISKTYLEENKGDFPVYSSQTQNNGEIGKINTYDFDGEFVNWTTDGANAGTVFYRKGKFSITNVSGLIVIKNQDLLNYKFLYYWLLIEAKKHVYSGMGNPKLMSHQMEKIRIPIPSLEIQEKIVKILDIFTELEATLEATLEAELSLRVKQYDYYRNDLLTFGDDVEWKTLGEVGELIRGNGLQKKDFTETGVPAIHYGQIYTYFGTFADKTKTFVSADLAKKLKKAQFGDVLIAGTSENLQDVMKPLGWLGGEIVFSGDMFAFRPNQEINTKFLTYLLQTEDFQKYKERYAQGTKVIRMKSDNFLKYQIPIPQLATQQKIVEILDKFDRLTNSISEGLPKEIELRRKQYEYYREQLLNFSK
ncbi:restriction endonuclease subunit S [Actinobacillus pleuropneumoniae]|uniref:restriction endonuclease subunit S n=1 Tax=Actinobacillus pleuropneumoniae TaxID=715 RepID=UPI003B986662